VNIGLISLGCCKNRVDSEVMLYRLKKAGHRLVSQPEKADLIIVNTCAFIEDARQEAIDKLLAAGQLKSGGQLKYLVAAGCLAQRYNKYLLEEMPELDALVGISHCDEIDKIVEQIQAGQRVIACREAVEESRPSGGRVLTTPKGMAYLRIADGCDNHCTYCAIPGIRGALRSKPLPQLIQEASRLVAREQIRELVVIAQDTAAYGMDLYAEKALPALLDGLQNIEGLEWIRLMYLHPAHMDETLIEAVASHDKVLPYLDVPVQHVSDRVLSAMNRRHDSLHLLNLMARLKERLPGLVLRTTVMTGFPGESEDDFKLLSDFVAETGFDWLGAFCYNPEEGTAAASMPDQVPDEVKAERLDSVMKLQKRITRGKNIARIGSRHKVLITAKVASQLYMGRGYYQAPEVDGITMVRSTRTLPLGQFAKAELKAVKNYDMIGEAEDESSQ
jgi:ribosomal protein S12 methylthiotransferase